MSNPLTILIVDDELRNRKLLEALLHPEGYRTVCAAGGEEALTLVAQDAPDLILLDIMMPGMDGYQVACQLKANVATSTIPIIMLTAQDDRAARLAGLTAGAEDFLTKPVDRAELWLRVRNLLRLKAFSDFFQNQSAYLDQQVQARTVELQRFRTAMDATADAIFLTSRNTMRFIEVNATACKVLGYTREELFHMGPPHLTKDTLEHLESVYDAMIAEGNSTDLVEMEVLRKDGTAMQVELHRQVQRSGSDWIVVGVMHDVTARKEAEKRLVHMAHYDALTGLPNRTLFYDTLAKTLAEAADNGWLVAVLCIDLDQFKNVNDTLGHAIGDELLGKISNRLMRCVSTRNTVGRLGGDEFALILVMRDGQEGATALANRIRDVLRPPIDLNGNQVAVTASIGIAIHPDDASDPETLLKYADTAMYRAKHAGRDTFRFFTAQMNADVLARFELEAALRKAIDNEEFVLYFQPKVQLSSGCVCGLETLLRWQRPGHGLVQPDEFVPALEDAGLIGRVGSWVIGAVCRQIAAWIRSPIGPVHVSVNVSGSQFIEGNLEADVINALHENDISGDLLELELTESSLLENTERTIACLQNLKTHGVQISIDDFGTGYSSLAYLRRFPIDKLKIDIAFIRDVISNTDAAAITLAIISMAHSLKLEVIAEGVETTAQLSFLRRHRCDQVQGFLFSPPLPVPATENMLREGTRLPATECVADPPLKTMLIVDDEAHILAALQRVFRQDGYRIFTAESASEGFELLALHHVHVILCDQRMPGMSGTDFLTRVKDLYPDTFRIILSGYTDLESIIDAINRGAIYRFYTKPWESKTLRNNVRDAFRHYWLLHDLPLEQPAMERRSVGMVH